MNINNKSGQKYLSEVKRHLKCTAATRNRFLATLEPELHNFEMEHRDASYTDYLAEFGEPKTAAQKCMDELSDREVFGYWQRIIIAIIAAVLVVLALMICYIITHRDLDDVPTYYVSEGDLSFFDEEQPVAAEE